MNKNNGALSDAVHNSTERKKLVARSIVIGLLGICGLPAMLISGMVFDAPGSENNFGAWIAFTILVTFTPFCILSIIISWIFFSMGINKLSNKVILFPFVIIIAVAIFVLYAFLDEFIIPLYKG